MKFSGSLSTLGLLLLLLGIIVLSLAIVLGFAVGAGWLLTLFLPLSLFEASLLGLIAVIIVLAFWYGFLSSNSELSMDIDDDNLNKDSNYDHIPRSRFYKANADKTWESWLRYQIADSIYVEFQDTPQPVIFMGEKQLQELAIRLADLTMTWLKAKTSRAKQLKVTVSTLKRQMTKIGQRPYDEQILDLASNAINKDLDFHYEDVITIIHAKSWQAPCDLFESE